MYPTVDENREAFAWGQPELENLREYAKKTFGWTRKRADEIVLPVVKRLNEKTTQQSIQNYFKITDVTSRTELKVSKRVRLALDQMSADPDAPSTSATGLIEIEKKKPRRKKEKKVDDMGGAEASPVKRPSRVRKRKITEPAVDCSQNASNTDSSFEVTTTTVTGSKKKVVLPDNNEPIPQRVKDKQAMESNKLKAIEILKQNKKKSNKK